MITSNRLVSFVLLVGLFWNLSNAGTETVKAAPQKLSIALSPFEGRGLEQSEASTLTDALASHLSNTGRFRVLERGKVDVILKEQGFQQSGACTDQACIVEMGQLLGVDHMVTGSIGKVGKTYSVNARMIKVATGEIVQTVSQYYKGEIDGLLTEVMPAVANEFVATLPGENGIKHESAPAVSTATPVASSKSSDGASREVKSSGTSNTLLFVLVGAAVVGGGVAVFLALNNKSSSGSEGSSTPSTHNPPTGGTEVLIW